MKLVGIGSVEFGKWVGCKFTCSETGNIYQFEQTDIQDIKSGVLYKKNHIPCPDCKKAVTFENDQIKGHYLLHK